MYRVTVIYEDHFILTYDHINKIESNASLECEALEGDAITSYCYMLGNFTYHLFSEDGAATVSVRNAISFEVHKED